eukprot:TRINITY_DN17851_c1_g1_i3.p1 TRINITY_DN17851_c1_g1~~TRINITY_DN17851_c1_g1_i3.p1  ORF type:complete len:967 (-),score=190.86 TRINITY_DN17851_c1_g1_i3:262-2880(-)
MVWRDTGVPEKYTGSWEDDHPHGEGTHTWYAPDPNQMEAGSKEMPSQQMNNSYEGQWVHGVRHGIGCFSYASGANYYGEWVKNVKQGYGRYTYEDGNVYNGLFTNDNMADPKANRFTAVQPAALNLGAEDNPVRRCIDVSDLEAFCLPSDRGERAAEDFSAYDEPHEVLREVYNMLLRNIRDIKKLYSQFRLPLKRPEDDPFVLYSYQLWMLIRDVGLIQPDCPLTRINRHVMCGPRHHQEACYEDLEELRPLTPRHEPVRPEVKAVKTSVPPSEAGHMSATDVQSQRLGITEDDGLECEDSYEDEGEEYYDDEEAEVEASTSQVPGSCEPDASSSKRPTRGSVSRGTTPQASHQDFRDMSPLRSPSSGSWTPNSHSIRNWTADVLGSKIRRFWRLQDQGQNPLDQKTLNVGKLLDIHAPNSTMMFRHFLESLVRMAVAIFPNGKGLEQQLRVLVKNRLIPMVGQPPSSKDVFGYLVDPYVQQVFSDYQTDLWTLFKENSTGEGSYSQPLLVKIEGVDDSSTNERRIRRHFGGVHRRVHLRCRLDLTIRVKDVLQILLHAGLMSSMSDRPELQTQTGTLFPNRIPKRPDTTETRPGTAPIEGLAQLGGLVGLIPNASPSPPPTPGPGAGDATTARISSSNGFGALSEAEKHSPSPTFDPAADAEAVEEFHRCNFQADFLQILEVVTEVYQPVDSARICWAVDRNSESEELALLDFLETEITFIEFQRLLLRISQVRFHLADIGKPISAHACLEGFLSKVFLPSLKQPYQPPVSQQQQAEKIERLPSAEGAASGTADEEGSASAAAEAPAEAEAKDEGDGAEAKQDEEERVKTDVVETFDFWYGFNECTELEEAVLAAPRKWPDEYSDEVASW